MTIAGGRPVSHVQATPDTGATVSLLAYIIAQQQNLFVNKLKRPALVNASGLPMQVEGSSNLRDDLLIGCEDL